MSPSKDCLNVCKYNTFCLQSPRSHHVLQVNEGVVDGHNFDAFLEAGPQDQAANAAKAADRHRLHNSEFGDSREMFSKCLTTPWELPHIFFQTPSMKTVCNPPHLLLKRIGHIFMLKSDWEELLKTSL